MTKSDQWKLAWYLWLIPTYVGAFWMGTWSRWWMHTYHHENLLIPLIGAMVLVFIANKLFIFDYIWHKYLTYKKQEIENLTRIFNEYMDSLKDVVQKHHDQPY